MENAKKIAPELPEVARGSEQVSLHEEAVNAGGLSDCGQVPMTMLVVGVGVAHAAVVTAARAAARLAGVAPSTVEDVRGPRCNVE